MSGPKVVRIVTREENEAICRSLLARIDAALDEWSEAGRRNDCLDATTIEAARRRRDTLAALVGQGKFTEMKAQAPSEESFLRSDMRSRLEKVAAAKAAARTHARRRVEAAATLLRALRAAGIELSGDMVRALERGDEASLAEGFGALSARRSVPEATSALAEQLRPGATVSFADWLAEQPAPESDPGIARIEARLDELASFPHAGSAERLQARLDEARQAQPSRRGLILDGLEVETGRALAQARRVVDLISALRMLHAEMAQAGLLVDAFEVVDGALGAEAVQARVSAAEAALADHRVKGAAAARRAAVMKGLAGLGYEIREGMTTAFAASGNLVVADSARPGYGVEVSGAADGRQFQMRPVAFEAPGQSADASRDRDAETIWCSQVTALSKSLADGGDGLEIVRALPIGATPLKRVSAPDQGVAEEAAANAVRERSLPRP